MERALLHRRNGGADVGVGGEHDDERVGVGLLDLLENLEPVGVGQCEVEQDEVRSLAMLRDRLAGRAAFERAIALFLETIDARPANQRFVVNHQHGCMGHQ